MTLPKIKHTLNTVEIPSTGAKVKFRPFTVQEEKLLMMVAAGRPDPNDEKSRLKFVEESVSVIKQVINNCAVEELEVDGLATFDVEWIFLQLRSFSVGEQIQLTMTKEGKTYFGGVDLREVQVKRDPEHSNKIDLGSGVGVIMKYPTFETATKVSSGPVDGMMDVFVSCIDKIYDDQKVYPSREYSKADLVAFVESLPSSAFKSLGKFFETMPSIEHEVTLRAEDGSTEKFTLKGIDDFF